MAAVIGKNLTLLQGALVGLRLVPPASEPNDDAGYWHAMRLRVAHATLAAIDQRRLIATMTADGVSGEEVAQQAGTTQSGLAHIRHDIKKSGDVRLVSLQERVFRCLVEDGDRDDLVDTLCADLAAPRRQGAGDATEVSGAESDELTRLRREGFLTASELSEIEARLVER